MWLGARDIVPQCLQTVSSCVEAALRAGANLDGRAAS